MLLCTSYLWQSTDEKLELILGKWSSIWMNILNDIAWNLNWIELKFRFNGIEFKFLNQFLNQFLNWISVHCGWGSMQDRIYPLIEITLYKFAKTTMGQIPTDRVNVKLDSIQGSSITKANCFHQYNSSQYHNSS
jgi:hypothetical protein